MHITEKGTVETFDAYAEFLKLASPGEQAELLLAKISEGEYKGQNGLRTAIERERFEMAVRCVSMLNQLAPNLSANKRTALWNELKDCEEYIANAMQNPSSLQRVSKLQQSFVELKTALRG